MKKIFLILTVVFLSSCSEKNESTAYSASSVNNTQKSSITIKGSDTVLPITQKVAESFMEEHPAASITIVGGGSGVGITALSEKTTDIAMTSRPIKLEEKLAFKEKQIQLSEAIVSYDALSIVVNPENKIGQLTKEQISDIFTGKIKNWKDVGGIDMKIIVYSRESSSGTFEFFKEHVMDNKNYDATVLSMPATGAIVQSVSQTNGAIGYIGFAYDTKAVKNIAVSYDKGKTFVLPSIKAAQNGTYPIARPLYFYYDSSNETTVKPFIDYVLSSKGQADVLKVGYVPLYK